MVLGASYLTLAYIYTFVFFSVHFMGCLLRTLKHVIHGIQKVLAVLLLQNSSLELRAWGQWGSGRLCCLWKVAPEGGDGESNVLGEETEQR